MDAGALSILKNTIQELSLHRWHSDEIDKLATALAKAQAEIKDAALDSTNPHFRSDYATLTSCWAAVRAPFSKNGLAITQLTRIVDDEVVLDTVLLHNSGQWVRSTYPVRPEKPTPQGFGSALTYAKRYSLCGIGGIAPAGDDDDGNAASSPTPPARKAAPQKPHPVRNVVSSTEAAMGPQSETPNRPITDAQRKMLWARAKEREEQTGTDAREIIDHVCFAVGIEEKNDEGRHVFRQGNFDAVLESLKTWQPA
jgi:hypothetical protein